MRLNRVMLLKLMVVGTIVVMPLIECRSVVITSVIENVLQSGTRSAGNKPGTSVFIDSTNNLRVILTPKQGE